MFWARTRALEPLLAIDAPAEAFMQAPGPLDGTLASAIELLYGVSCTVAGFNQVFVTAVSKTPEAEQASGIEP